MLCCMRCFTFALIMADSRRQSRSTFQYIFAEIGDPLKRQEVDQMLRDFNAVDESDDVLYPLVVHKLLEI